MHHLKPAASHVPSAEAWPFLRIWAVTHLTGLGRSTIYRLVAEDRFPLRVRLASRAVAWRRCDIERWSEARPLACRQLSSPRRVKGGRGPAPANP